jgi:sortase A
VKSGVVARWLRRAEIALSVLGISLLGGALAAIVNTRVYQARQGRAFSDMEEKAAAPYGPESPPASAANGQSTLAPAADPLVLGRIEIPRIGVSAIVREGDDDTTLGLAVGHIPGTALPGERGNMALAGHRDSFFRALKHIQLHDTIRIRTASRRYEYLVDSTEVVAPEETRLLDPTRNAVLTLVTCYPFGWIGHAPNRFVVRARLSSLAPLPLEHQLPGTPIALTSSVQERK